MSKNSSKPFRKYVKSRKQDNIGVVPLKKQGHLVNDSKKKNRKIVTIKTTCIGINFTKGTVPSMLSTNTKDPINQRTDEVRKLLQDITLRLLVQTTFLTECALKTKHQF